MFLGAGLTSLPSSMLFWGRHQSIPNSMHKTLSQANNIAEIKHLQAMIG